MSVSSALQLEKNKKPQTLGSYWDGAGVHFAIASLNADHIELCTFENNQEIQRYRLPEQTDGIFHGYLPNAKPGLHYGYRAYGTYAPEQGKRFNGHKLLIDPYAKALSGQIIENDALYDYQRSDLAHHPDLSPRALRPSALDSAPFMPKSVVTHIDVPFRFQKPHHDWENTLIYECHVKGFSKMHPKIDPAIRGTYEALKSPDLIEHLLTLEVTAIELLPIQTFLHDFRLIRQGLSNYWGYQPIQYFTLMRDYFASKDACVAEWQSTVDVLHQHGIEVILDVVYNHTGEGDHLGPSFSFRGLDQSLYYATDHEGFLMDSSGCGNRLNLSAPLVQRLVMDSLRFWVKEMGVDGFRFDLCTALGRNHQDQNLDLQSGIFSMIAQDPSLQQVKLIAEPWDLGENGYALGQFPSQWSEWNDQFRNSIRRFWKGDPRQKSAMASALCGSSQIFHPLSPNPQSFHSQFKQAQRSPRASIQAICTHDGFCLEDLVCYRQKHNWANLENNHDGPDHHDSDHYGVEGFTDDPQILALRQRQKMNLIATWAISKGTLMILGGDEMGRSQRGNNNAYCQDHELSYLDWEQFEGNAERQAFYGFCCRMIKMRKESGIFGNGKWLYGQVLDHHGIGRNGQRKEGLKDVTWLRVDGRELEDWDDWEEEDVLIACFAGEERVIYVAMNRSRDKGRWVRLPEVIGSDEVHSGHNGHDGHREWRIMVNTGGDIQIREMECWVKEMSLIILMILK